LERIGLSAVEFYEHKFRLWERGGQEERSREIWGNKGENHPQATIPEGLQKEAFVSFRERKDKTSLNSPIPKNEIESKKHRPDQETTSPRREPIENRCKEEP